MSEDLAHIHHRMVASTQQAAFELGSQAERFLNAVTDAATAAMDLVPNFM